MSEDNYNNHLVFNRGCGGTVAFVDLIQEIKNYLDEDPSRTYALMIGTDSEERETGVEFVTAIVVYRKGAGGRYFWQATFVPQNFKSLFERIWQEALASLKLSMHLIEAVKDIQARFSFELHVDIGENGETKTIVREIVSSLRSSGLLVKTKPESFAASKVADRHL